jgi:hypothetical protein
MRYKQPKKILLQCAKTGSPKLQMACIELLALPLPTDLGGYRSGSPENLYWRLASNEKASSAKRYKALCTLLILLAQKAKT